MASSLMKTKKGGSGKDAGVKPVHEDQIVDFPTMDVETSMKRAKSSLLGRLFMETRPSLSVILRIVQGAWNCSKNVVIMEAKGGLLQFLFDDDEDMERVLQRTPLPVKDHVLQLQKWEPITEAIMESLAFSPFWVQMWGIPLHCREVAFRRTMAEAKIEEVLDAGLFGICGEFGNFIKTRVKLNVLQPLRSKLCARNEVAGEFWVYLIYEFLPLLCYHCGRLRHLEKNCSFPDPEGDEEYGPRMSTNVIDYRLNAEVPRLPKSVWINPNLEGAAKRESRDDDR
ncbi:unnamed protein product [Linum trigynum]|uniref:CCHC-type domain-containing protein n=1 Tax=Linum trigynum TaxID=586398 RepID=A0AAV2FYY2_9ROSI